MVFISPTFPSKRQVDGECTQEPSPGRKRLRTPWREPRAPQTGPARPAAAPGPARRTLHAAAPVPPPGFRPGFRCGVTVSVSDGGPPLGLGPHSPPPNAPDEKIWNLGSVRLRLPPEGSGARGAPRGRSDSGRPPPAAQGGSTPGPSAQAPHPRKATGSSPRLPHDATMTACTSMSLHGDRECLELSEAGDARTDY